MNMNPEHRGRFLLVIRAFLVCAIGALQPVFGDVLFLTMPMDARGMSIGEATTASARGVTAMRFNPAGLGFASPSEIQASHFFLGPDLSAESFMASYSFAPYFSAGVFGNVLYLNDSIQEVSNYQKTGNSLQFLDIDTGASFGYSFIPNLSAGLTVRYFRFKLGQEVAQNVGFDIGLLYRFNPFEPKKSYRKFSVGLAVRNIGPSYDYYGGGSKQPQPLQLRTGLSYNGFRYVEPSADVVYSELEGMSYHGGLVFLPHYIISPRMGVKYDFSGLSMSFGGGISYGQNYKFNLIGGTSLSTGGTSYSNTFFSILVQASTSAGPQPANTETKTYEPRKIITMEAVGNMYRANLLVPYNPPVRAEKIQGIVIQHEKAEGFTQIVSRLRRVALQPEDEKYIRKMQAEKADELVITNRTMGIWLMPSDLPTEDVVDWWDMLSELIEARANAEVMLGVDMDNLNQNRNAPLKVELKLEVHYVKVGALYEFRTVLKEMYTRKVVLAKNFKVYEGEEPVTVWRNIALFYSDYFSKMKSFYKIRIQPEKKGA